MLFKRKFTLETDPASWAAGAAVLSAGAGTYSAISSANKKGVIKPSAQVTQDASVAESDDLLRRRQRQGIKATLLELREPLLILQARRRCWVADDRSV
jgi:uncharacterized protein (UPF0254 family)